MKDIKLDWDNRELINEYVDDIDRVIQQARLGIQTFKGEWMLDESWGVDYINGFGDTALLERDIKNVLNGIDGITNIVSVSITKDIDERININYQIEINSQTYEGTEVV